MSAASSQRCRGPDEAAGCGAIDVNRGGVGRERNESGVLRPGAGEASTFKMVSAATEELTASICEINVQVAKSSRIAADAVVEAWRTDATVQGLAAAGRLAMSSALIHTIAGPTSLPPLMFGISRDIRYLRQYRAGFTRGIPMISQT